MWSRSSSVYRLLSVVLSIVLLDVLVVRGERAAKPKKLRVLSLMWMGLMRVPM